MNTTTITGHGVHGQQVTKELPAQGEIVVITTGTPRTGIRHTVARVTGWDTRSITGTEYGYYVVVAVAADGEELTDARFRPATAEEIAEYEAATAPAEVPFEIISDERAARLAHIAGCVKCRYSGQTGRSCHIGQELADADLRASHDLNRAPIIIRNRWGTRRAYWNAVSVLGELDHGGATLVKAPAGMIEAGRREAARQREESRQRLDALKAAGHRIGPPRRW
jgi:hypothetical protein